MSHPVVERREAERADRIAVAAAWADHLPAELDVVAVVVFGSVARGDFNKWSDLDVLVVARALPPTTKERLDVLFGQAPAGLQPIGWTPDELTQRRRRGDPIAVECDTVGVVVRGALP